MNKGSKLTSFDRLDRIAILSSETFDIVVIGGGATGAGIALDAASRGLKTALVEKGDFASGTSSKSTKLIHGGLRYLKQLDVALVRESGTERSVVNKLAPHLCLPEKMLLPLVKDGSFSQFSTSIGLWVYDFVASVDARDKRIMLTKEQTLEKEPKLNKEILEGGGYYAEYRTDDARLTLEIVKKAANHGAVPINYAPITDFIYKKGKICGVICQDRIEGEIFRINALKVVSAAGPWVDQLREKNESLTNQHLYLTKGVHIVVPKTRLPLDQSVYFDVPDGRMVFAIPRGKVTYIGTTDTEYTGDLNRVVATEEDRDYLLRAVNHMFPDIHMTRFDVISNWAGLRPLIHEEGKSPSEVSRRDEIFESPNGLLSIAGGKLTGYRKMAERIVDKVLKALGKEVGYEYAKTRTKTIKLTPAPFKSNIDVELYIELIQEKCKELNTDPDYGWYLVTTYGRQAEHILKLVQSYSDFEIEISLALAEVEFCLQNEMIQRLDDYFVRRSGRLYFDIHSIQKIRKPVSDIMAASLNWTKDRIAKEEKHLDQLITDATTYYSDENVPANDFL